ncbi:uncharacterized protein A4U43_C05F9370 [Asparagus officinalis]|uniref:Pentatricopeptide repeat-containing protein n=1 Tax=Asparagus officinalis TaxID=4686 RepID=A0A5P1EQI0_ASPOF|nr:pentatricopeptide repeat-containing protein At3g05340 [Asparagus officinalis]ONK68258.1 uncharacterized protein A4U43_C05F9370 [Asparagus officinalis]
MRNVTLSFDPVKISALLSLCGQQKYLTLGSSIHASIFKLSPLLDPQNLTLLSNSLISMYSKCNKLPEATVVFNQRASTDTITWNSIIMGHLINNEPGAGFGYLQRMRRSGFELDPATLTTVLSVCAKPEMRYACEMMHCLIVSSGFEQIVPVGNALVSSYFKCGCASCAYKVFGEMRERNVVTWTAMVSGLAHCEFFEEGLILFREMRREDQEANSLTYSSSLLACSGLRALREGKQIHGLVLKSGFELDLCVKSALMDLYSKCGVMEDACMMFRSCEQLDEVALTVMLVGLAQNGFEENALKLFVEMVGKSIEIDANMVSAVLGAFDVYAPFALGKQIHSSVIKKGLGNNVFVCNGLINMYSKCGELRDSIKIFDSMVQRNAVSWNSMIAAFARHGYGSTALQLYENMKLEGIEPTDVTYISLLHACSHVGSVNKGMEFLDLMLKVHHIEPRIEHYSCVVDMLGRAGLLKEAQNFIEGLMINPKALLWQALLGACGIYGALDIGKYAAERLLLEERDSSSAHVLLANIYSSEGKWEERARIAMKMKEMGVKKDTGLSWIEVGMETHSFVVEDKAHSQSEAIYEVLHKLISIIGEEDHLHDLDL